MEDLFSTNINIKGQSVGYRVVFENDQYKFISEASGNDLSSFSFKRENDEWHSQDQLPAELATQAIAALEKYLLQQH